MNLPTSIRLSIACAFCCVAIAQTPDIHPKTAANTIPRLVRFSGTVHTDNPAAGLVGATFSIYSEQEGGTAIWTEERNLELDEHGNYTLLLGSATNEGVPVDLFASGEPRWLDVQIHLPGQLSQPRTLLVSVPYALRASDAETLGGLPVSAFALAGSSAPARLGPAQLEPAASIGTASVKTAGVPRHQFTSSGSTNYIPKFTDTSGDIGNSGLFQNGNNIGLGTTAAAIPFDIRPTPGSPYAQLGVAQTVDYMTLFASDTYGPAFYWDPTKALRFGKGGTGLYNANGFVEYMRIQPNGYVGIGTESPSATLQVNGNASQTVFGNNTLTSGTANGVFGQSASTSGFGVYGTNSATSGFAVGVGGTTASPAGAGISGYNSATSGGNGGQFTSAATSGGNGVYAGIGSANGAGVNGYNSYVAGAPGSFPVGVQGTVNGPTGAGLSGNASLAGAFAVNGYNSATSGYAVGIQGGTASNGGAGVQGNAGTGAFAVSGFNSGTSGWGVGTQGATSSPNGIGVLAVDWLCGSTACTLVPGTAAQLQTATTGLLLQGLSGAAGTNNGTATQVFSVDGFGDGNFSGWLQGNSNSANNAAVSGNNSATTGFAIGVQGTNNSTGGGGVLGTATQPGAWGVQGSSNASTGSGAGVFAESASPNGSALLAQSQTCGSSGCLIVSGIAGNFMTSTTGLLLNGFSGPAGASNGDTTQVFYVDGKGDGYFKGNLTVGGNISKGGGSFRIDHPLDPENKYLYHSFVESPDMKNIYDGVATLDQSGEATITLPDWFEALNRDFRYQLTCIGGYAPVYIASEVAGNQFRIAGGRAGLKVSWQVTGIRHDAYAEAHRIPVEADKTPAEKQPLH